MRKRHIGIMADQDNYEMTDQVDIANLLSLYG